MGVRGDRRIGCGDEETAGHSEVDEELGGLLLAHQVDDYGLADTVNAVDATTRKGFDDFVGRGFEGLRFVARPDGPDGLTVDASMNAVGYCFDFGELWHGLLQV